MRWPLFQTSSPPGRWRWPVNLNREDYYWWRLLGTTIGFAGFGIGGALLGYLLFPLVHLFSRDVERAQHRCRLLVHYAFRLFIWALEGLGVFTSSFVDRHLLAQPGQLIVANHPTLIDIVYLIAAMPDASCIVKASLRENFFLRGPVTWTGYIANDDPEELISACASALNGGASLAVFPEGTRSAPGSSLHFKRGAAHIALTSDIPVRLVCITCTPSTLTKNDKWYQIPFSRPHLALSVLGDEAKQTSESGIAPKTMSPRELTAAWLANFKRETAA